jgi:hypothetical protein
MKSETNFKLFISYSIKDKKLVSTLANGLINSGIELIYDENNIEAGRDWQKKLKEEYNKADGKIVLITPNSISSNYVMKEVEMASALVSDDKNKKLFLSIVYGEVDIPSFIKNIQTIFWRNNDIDVINQITSTVFAFFEQKMDSNTNKFGNRVNDDQVSQNSDYQNYWLFKMNPETWNIDRLDVDEMTFFSPYYLNEERPEFQLFEKINRGDLVLGLALGDYSGIVCILEVTDPVGPDKKQGIVFKMKVKRKISPIIPLFSFEEIILNILPRLKQSTLPPELFFHLDESSYNSILQAKFKISEGEKHFYQPFYLTEGDHHSTTDQLDFDNDIDSFATVIALKKVNPPLAIGLFGNWGSGKSFFMEKLSDRIEEISKEKDSDYLEHIVPVKFNSWHYSDTNLWASLTTQIFESLNDYAQKKNFGEEAIKNIYKDLNFTSHQLEETQKKLDANNIQSDVLNEKLVDVEETINQKKEKLKIWSAGDLVKVVFSDPLIQNDFQNIKAQFENEKLIENINQIEEKLVEIDSVGGKLNASFLLLKEHRKGNWVWVWILSILFIVIAWLVLGPLKEFIQHFIDDGVAFTSLLVTGLGTLTLWLKPYFNKITQFYKRLKSLKETIEKEKEAVRLKEHDEINRLNKDLNLLKAEKATLILEKQNNLERKQNLQNELTQIGSGKMLANFLSGKTMDDAYIKQLGIISWIRKDLAKLDELFKKQKSIQNKEETLHTEVQIDRIVLYIDDLDRCNEDVVVKVLEAIHLLLAFPLFVVVVGVDPRWLNNALSEKYKNLFANDIKKKQDNEDSDKKNQTKSMDNNDLFSGVASSYDYLEKIFQIPFALKPISKPGREKLIQYLIRDEMQIKEDAETTEMIEASSADINNSANVTLTSNQTNELKTTSSTEEKLHEAKRAKEKLVFSLSERLYMQKISALFGKTPRSINRYVNIYRIIKAHESLKINGDFSENEFMPIMFILGVIVGYSIFAKEFLENIAKADDSQEFGNFIDNVKLDATFKTQVKLVADDIKSLLMEDFKRNLELISRFSFRTLLQES